MAFFIEDGLSLLLLFESFAFEFVSFGGDLLVEAILCYDDEIGKLCVGLWMKMKMKMKMRVK
jgi:hypothetical protein